MYKTSTYFIKEQIPGKTVPELLHLYKQELQDQSVSNIQIENNDLTFSNETFRFVWNSYSNKFSNFKSGRIKIEDNDIEYLVTLEADNSRTLIVAGIIAGVVTLFSLISSNFGLSSLLIGLVAFALVSGISYGMTSISFPVYFTSVRNNIERRIASGEIKETKHR